MPVLSSVVVSLILFICTLAWMVSHLLSWREVKQRGLEGDELNFRWRQFRRRMQTSAMLGILAVALLVGPFLTEPPGWVLAFWGGVVLLVIWVILLALVDVWATKYHFGRVRQTYLAEQAKLQAELHRIRAVRGNGKARDKETGQDAG